jgi:hypothetical protein
MKNFTASILLSAMVIAAPAQAHDPSLHKEKAEKPDCAAMEGMDHSKMDASDPVMQAMMKKCGEQMQHDDHSGHGEDAHSEVEKSEVEK